MAKHHKRKTKRRAGYQPPPVQLGGRAFIVLYICDCPRCRGRGAACTNAFGWLDDKYEDHSHAHAIADLFGIGDGADGFDGLPGSVKDALRSATINVCSRCVNGWLEMYGEVKTVQLICDARFIDDKRAVTPIDGWSSQRQR